MAQVSPSAIISKIRQEAALFDSKDRLLNFSTKGDFQSPLIMEAGDLFFEKWKNSNGPLPLDSFFPVSDKFSAQQKAETIESVCTVLKEKDEDFGRSDLYLLLGFLKWDGNALAPSLLIPLDVDTTKKTLYISNRTPIENVVLRERLKDSVPLPKAGDAIINGQFSLLLYFSMFEKSIASMKSWKFTRHGLCLGFFNTGRLLLKNRFEQGWNDKKIDTAPVLSSLLREDGFKVKESIFEEKDFNQVFNPCEHHFLYTIDSHTSKAAIDALDPEVEAYAIQALPGTAKMKVAANIVADSVAQGKNVLVVSRRATTAREFLNTWKPPFRTFANVDRNAVAQELHKARKDFSDYYDAVNKPLQPSGIMLSGLLKEFIKARAPKQKFPETIFQGVPELSFERYEALKKDLAELTELYFEKNGIEARTAFQGVKVPSLTPEQKNSLADELNRAAERASELDTILKRLQEAGLFPTGIFLAGLSDILELFKDNFSESTPTYDQWQLRSSNWDAYRETLSMLPEAGDKWVRYRRQTSDIYTDNAVDENILTAREDFVESQKATLKGLSDRYRSSRRQLLQVLRNPKEVQSDAQLIDLIDTLLELQDNKKAYKESAVLGNHLLGKDWLYERSNWIELNTKIQYLYDFRDKHKDNPRFELLLQILEQWSLFKDLQPKLGDLCEAVRSLQQAIRKITKEMNLEEPLESQSIEKWLGTIKSWNKNWDSLDTHLQLSALTKKIADYNCPNLSAFLKDPSKANREIPQAVAHHWAGSQVQTATKVFPELFSLNPKAHAQKGKEYRDIQDRFCNANFRELHDTLQASPERLTSISLSDSFCLPEDRHFDIAIILDAECVSVVESIPTLLSANKIILVGDPHYPTLEPLTYDAFQEPPISHTTLFHDSILSASLRQGISTRELWFSTQYSDATLVSFANQKIYSRGIRQLPVPSREKFTGIKLKVVQNKVNAIAQAAIRHAEKNPSKTLGIVAFHQTTCHEIEECIKNMVAAGSATARFFTQQNPDIRYYVKTPERAAGRFRDVILVCAESEGVTGVNGDNKIAVCSTLAKHETHVYISETDLAKQGNAKHNLFWDWITYLQAKDFTEKNDLHTAGSDIHDSIVDALKKENFQIEDSFTKGGIPVGPVVADANNPSRFLALIEDDCTTERFRESVEDRDYIRPTILKQTGWKVLALWLPFWYMANQDEVSHLVTTLAIEQSIAPPPAGDEEPEDEDELEMPVSEGPQVVAYQVQHPKIEGTPHDKPIAELPAAAIITQLKFYVDHEAPIHEEILIQRILELHHVDRAGPVLQKALTEALNQGLQKKRFVKTGPFYYSLKPQELVPRNRSGRPDFERNLVFVGPEERALLPSSMDEHAIKQALGLLV